MGVWVFPNLVKRENGIVKIVKNESAPKAKQIFYLNDLIFLRYLRNSLIELANESIDLSFFTKHNDYSYGDEENINISFTPNEVLNCIDTIEKVFLEKGDKFIMPYKYNGLYDGSNNQIRCVFVENVKKGFFKSKKSYQYGNVQVNDKKCYISVLDTELNKWIEIDLTKENPRLFSVKQEKGNDIKGELLSWHLEKVRFYDLLKPEFDNLIELAKYAKENNLELQITHS
jgi:hypothetical protein